MSGGHAGVLGSPAVFIVEEAIGSEIQGDLAIHSGDATWPVYACAGLRLLTRLRPLRVVLLTRRPASATCDKVRELPIPQPLVEADGIRVDARCSYPWYPTDQTQSSAALARAIRRTGELLGVDLCRSLLISDDWNDMRTALDLDCQPVLLMTGNGWRQMSLSVSAALRARTWYASDLSTAAVSVEAHWLALHHAPLRLVAR